MIVSSGDLPRPGLPAPCPDLDMSPPRSEAPAADEVHSCPVFPTGANPLVSGFRVYAGEAIAKQSREVRACRSSTRCLDLCRGEDALGEGQIGEIFQVGEPVRTGLDRVPGLVQESADGRGSDARLGLHAPGGDRVGECRVIAFGLVGVGFAEFGHGLVESV